VAFDTAAGGSGTAHARRGAVGAAAATHVAADAPAARAGAQRPSPLYILGTPDAAYESRAAKFERLQNVLLLPPFLERAIFFGALACLDAWLHTFTVLPIRFCLALNVLIKWCCT